MLYQPPFYKKIFHSARRILAKYWLSMMPAIQIAITGSQGKTNTARLISTVLSSIGPTVATDVNLDTIYNVPITALKVLPRTKFAVFELGVDHPNEMDMHLEIVKPKIGLVTGISPVHTDQEHLGSLENLIIEKRKLIEVLPDDGYAILNYDDLNVRAMASHTKAKVLWYGTDSKHCNVWVDPKTIKLSLAGTRFKLFSTNFNQFQPSQTWFQQISTKLIGSHQIYTIMAAMLVIETIKSIKKYDLSIYRLIEFLKELKPLPGRMSVEPGPFGTIILNDALRANPSSTASGLVTLSEIKRLHGRKIAILAEMGELQRPEEEHKKIISLIDTLKIDYVITVGPLYRRFLQSPQTPESPQIHRAKDVYAAAEFLKKILKKGDLIYLKGSLHRHVERVSHILEGKKPPADLILEKY